MNRRGWLFPVAAQTSQPVVGIMIRTNTELKKRLLGPFTAGQTVRVAFQFPAFFVRRSTP